MTEQEQKIRFEKNWEKWSQKFGTVKWDAKPNFLYFVEIPLSLELCDPMSQIGKNLKKIDPSQQGFFVAPEKMHITLALPARIGEHFHGNDVNVMDRALRKVLDDFEPFELVLGNVNCFADSLFREVYDPSGELLRLHCAICKEIPFAQNPGYQFENFFPHIALFYGKGNAAFLKSSDFQRELTPSPMKVDTILFGRARNEKDEYEKKILKEYRL